jgi:peptide/nickel transport system permease protein
VDRAVDFLSSLLFILPGFLLLLVVGSILELKLATLYLIAGCLLWPPAARLVRAEVRVLRSARFVISERASGFSTPSILLRSIIPLTLLPAFIALLYMLPELLGLDLGLSLFGVGAVDPATPTLGRLVYQGLMDARSAWWLAVFPTATMALVCAVAYVVAEFASRGMVAQPDKQSS